MLLNSILGLEKKTHLHRQKGYKKFFSGLKMHYPPDLNLASSYIPACLCTLKSMLAFMLFVFSPVRGWIGLCCLALVDRNLWNNSQTSILDVNSVVVSLIGGLMVMHSRSEGLHSVMHLAVISIWMLVSGPQIVGISKLHRSYEVILAGCCVAMLSCMHQAQERTELLALRAFVFVVINIALPYIGVMMQQYETDTYVNVCRTLLILLGEPEVACFWVVIYIICIGYQVRASKQPSLCYDSHDQQNVVTIHAKAAPSLPSMASPEMSPQSSDDSSSLLRKALANRRERDA